MIRRPCSKCFSIDTPKKKYKTVRKGKIYHVITRICIVCLRDMDKDYYARDDVKKRKAKYGNEYYKKNRIKLNKLRRQNYHKNKNKRVQLFIDRTV